MHNAKYENMPQTLDEVVDYKMYTVKAFQALFSISRARVRKLLEEKKITRVSETLSGTRILFTGREIKLFADRLANNFQD